MNLSSLVSPLRRLKALLHRRDGMAAVEFALIAPAMLVIYVGSIELTMLMMADRKLTLATSTMGDLVARMPSVTNCDIDDVFEVSRLTLLPYDNTVAKLRLSSVVHDASDGQTKVAWSQANSKWTPHSPGDLITLPTDLLPAGGSVILAEVEYRYDAKVGTVIGSSWTLDDEYYLRPRRVDAVTRTVVTNCP